MPGTANDWFVAKMIDVMLAVAPVMNFRQCVYTIVPQNRRLIINALTTYWSSRFPRYNRFFRRMETAFCNQLFENFSTAGCSKNTRAALFSVQWNSTGIAIRQIALKHKQLRLWHRD
jgi:hypothetical protein